MVKGPLSLIVKPGGTNVEKALCKENPGMTWRQARKEADITRAKLGPKSKTKEIVEETNKRLHPPAPKKEPVAEEREMESEENTPATEPNVEEREEEPEQQEENEPDDNELLAEGEEEEEEEESEVVPGLTCTDIKTANNEAYDSVCGCW